MQAEIRRLREDATRILTENILPFWIDKAVDTQNGGFYGRISGDNRLFPSAPKGAVLNSRILWTFAAAYRLFGNNEYLQTAERAKEYLITRFFDEEFGGIYWLLDEKGRPLDTKKQIYAQAFAVYGLSEYYRATGDEEALIYAIKLYRSIEQNSFDAEKNGYLEAFTRNWKPMDDMRLSEKDANEQKTMNTHLHILEPYTHLFRVWKDDSLKKQLKNLIEIFLNKMIDSETNHLQLFFDADWNNKSEAVSYGHDIEATWLLHEAASTLADDAMVHSVEKALPLLLHAAGEGMQSDGSMAYEKNIRSGHLDSERHWWVQAETVVGFLNDYQYFGNESSLAKTLNCWEYIQENLIDRQHGEWYWSILPDGSVNRRADKAGIWKCPYHNGRMCMEIIQRAELLLNPVSQEDST